jgi:hypothetical protein
VKGGIYEENDLTASVGKYGPDKKPCYNTTSDQHIVQDLLNKISDTDGGAGTGSMMYRTGTLKSSPQWGVVSEELYQAILTFQRKHAQDEGLSVDGHVDPHERTLRALLKHAYPLMHIDTDALARDLFGNMRKPSAPITPPPAKVGTPAGVMNRTSWRLTGSDSFGGSFLFLSGAVGSFELERDGVPMKYHIGYSLAGGGSSGFGKFDALNKVPGSKLASKGSGSWGPGWAPQMGTSVWSLARKDLDFQELIGPMVALTGALAFFVGVSGSLVWFNSPLGLGLALKTAAAAGADRVLEQMRWMNQSSGGVAFLAGPEASSPDASFAVLTGLGWPDNS